MKTVYIRISALLISLAILSASFLGCTSTTFIHSMPEGARLYMNDEFKGVTPYKHTDSALSLTTTSVVLKKEGYEDFHTILVKNEQVDVGAIVGGIFFVFPFIWTMGYNPSHNYELFPIQP